MIESTPLIDEDGDDRLEEQSNEPPKLEHQKRFGYDEALAYIGIGRFHWILVLLCGWANASDAVEVLCLSLILPSVQCDLKLSSEKLGVLTAVIFLGMMLGGYFWGSFGDVCGRRTVLICSLFVNGFFGLISSFAQTYWLFVFCRFFSGVGVGGSVPVIWSYFVEWIPPYCRGRMLSLVASFWMIGQMLTAGFAWIIIPNEHLSVNIFSMELKSWRIFMILSTIVCLSSSFLMMCLPESPKYLLHTGRKDEAVKILEKVCRMNKKIEYDVAKLKAILTNDDDSDETFKYPRVQSAFKLKSLYILTRRLFSPNLIRTTNTLFCINFSLAFGYYGLMMWFPELFSRARNAGHDGPICQASPNYSVSNNVPFNYCHPVDVTVFRDSFIIATSNLPGNIVAVLFIDRIGRKRMFVGSLLFSAASVFMIWFVQKQYHVLILSCLFGCVNTVGWNCLDCFSVESFPTELRSTAVGLSLGCARIGAILGNILFGVMLDTNCAVPVLTVAALLCFAAIISKFLPEKTRQAIS